MALSPDLTCNDYLMYPDWGWGYVHSTDLHMLTSSSSHVRLRMAVRYKAVHVISCGRFLPHALTYLALILPRKRARVYV